jgi:hypothetical protein
MQLLEEYGYESEEGGRGRSQVAGRRHFSTLEPHGQVSCSSTGERYDYSPKKEEGGKKRCFQGFIKAVLRRSPRARGGAGSERLRQPVRACDTACARL